MVLPALESALAGKPSLEARVRMENLVCLAKSKGWGPIMLQALRAIEVLEMSGTPEARAVLTTMAANESAGRLAQEAKVSLRRLAMRKSPQP